MRAWLFLAILSLAFSGCEGRGVNVQSHLPFDYAIDQTRSCFCPDDGVQIRGFAKADTIVDVIDLADNTHLSLSFWGRYRTIKGLFDEIASWDTSSFFVDVTMDSSNKYPARISVRPKANILDAGLSYVTSNLIELK